MTTREACDVILTLTVELRDARALIDALAEDVASYRLLARQAIHALHDLQQRERAHQERYRRLLAECRSLREQTRQQVAA